MYRKTAEFRFYEELNDFLPPERRKRSFRYAFNGSPSVKDAIEALGVPHTEIDLIIVGDKSVGFDYRLRQGDRLAVYPVFESLDISPVVHLRPAPLRTSRFVADVHLGKLARWLRMLGFDTLYRDDFEDSEIVRISGSERRIILTRDLGLLKAKTVTHGYWVRATKPHDQIREVIRRFDLCANATPFARCLRCNAPIHRVEKSTVENQLPPRAAESVDDCYQCSGCGRVYWRGSHYQAMSRLIEGLCGES